MPLNANFMLGIQNEKGKKKSIKDVVTLLLPPNN